MIPFQLQRLGLVMEPEPGNPLEPEADYERRLRGSAYHDRRSLHKSEAEYLPQVILPFRFSGKQIFSVLVCLCGVGENLAVDNRYKIIHGEVTEPG